MSLELDRAERYLGQELVNTSQPILRKLLLPHAWSLSGESARLSWLRGIWIGGRRGMLLTSDDRSALWMSIEAPAAFTREAGVATLQLHWHEHGQCMTKV